MQSHLLSLSFTLLASIATAQNDNDNEIPFPNPPNPIVSLSTCESLTCQPSNNSICSTGQSPGPEVGVGIASHVITTSSANLSLTLIDGLGANGFTGYIYEGYEYSDQSLFVGADPNLEDGDYPQGCALMMQYQGQTFPLQWSTSDEAGSGPREEEELEGTTSCTGVLDASCQSSIVEIIRGFDTSNLGSGNGSGNGNASDSWNGSGDSSSSSDRCTRLTNYINAQLRSNEYTCGQSSWIANFMNVTGGPLPGPETAVAENDRLGSEQCQPVIPERYELYHVADMRLFYFVDPPSSSGGDGEGEEGDFYSHVFGGRAGFTPVVSVLYGGDMGNGNDSQSQGQPEVQFTCMKTYQPDGEPRQDPFESGAGAGAGVGSLGLMGYSVLVALGFVLL